MEEQVKTAFIDGEKIEKQRQEQSARITRALNIVAALGFVLVFAGAAFTISSRWLAAHRHAAVDANLLGCSGEPFSYAHDPKTGVATDDLFYCFGKDGHLFWTARPHHN